MTVSQSRLKLSTPETRLEPVVLVGPGTNRAASLG